MTTESVMKEATELAISLVDCDWCIAKAGELCYPQQGSPDWKRTHMCRFAGLGTPEEFLAAHRKS